MAEQKPDMTGKVCIVTGATSGIGEKTACQLAELNAVVVVVGRSPEKCSMVSEEIKRTTGNTSVSALVADLSSQGEIRRAVDEFKGRFSRLDVLVNGAGAVFMSRRLSADGIEMTFALNHLGYFLLTNLLLDVLKASAPARIINLTSAIHSHASLDFNDLQKQHGFSGLQAYSQSKLANLLFTFELARRLEGTQVTVNALHPGFVATGFGQNNAGFLKPLVSLFRMGGISPEEAARNVIYLASSPEVEGITGSYFAKDRTVTSLLSYEEQTARLLWDVSVEMTGLGSAAEN